jgi:5-hydroxyisourate hydrolase-like protein (transthyretin family)
MKASLAAFLLVVPIQAFDSPAGLGPPAFQASQATTATIEGVAQHVATGAVIAGARVTLMQLVRVSNEFGGAEQAGTTVTDSQGRFRFPGLADGGYAVQIELDGYIFLTRKYLPPGADQRPGRVALVALTGGRSVSDLVFLAAPTGVITGRVVNAAGRPVAGIPIIAGRKSYDETGSETLGVGNTTSTNERGEYRLPLMPGSGYTVVARGRGDGSDTERYAGALYPGVTDQASALTIDVPSGGTVALKDLLLGPQQLYTIRGRVVDAETGQPPPEASVWITTTALLGGETITAMPSYDGATGTFETRVGPGRYALGANVPAAPAPQRMVGGTPPALPPIAREAIVSVERADVTGVVLRLVRPAISLPGRLRADGQPISSVAGWESIRVQLITLRDGIALLPNSAPPPLTSLPNGTFQLFGIMAGDFLLRITGLPGDAYVQSASFGATDALREPLRLPAVRADVFEIVVNPGGGRIDGDVTNDARLPAASVQAVLVPADRTRHDLFRSATTDERGRFTLRGVAPGEYRLFAWTATEPFAYFDPAVLKRFDAGSIVVRVAPSSTSTMTMVAAR